MLALSSLPDTIAIVTLLVTLAHAGSLRNTGNNLFERVVPVDLCTNGYSSEEYADCTSNCEGGTCLDVSGPCIEIHGICATNPIFKCQDCPAPPSSDPPPTTTTLPAPSTVSSTTQASTSEPVPTGNVTTSGNPLKKGYVAFGDSFAAGIGTGMTEGSGCRRGQFSYPSLLASTAPNIDFQNLACSGDTTKNILTGTSFYC